MLKRKAEIQLVKETKSKETVLAFCATHEKTFHWEPCEVSSGRALPETIMTYLKEQHSLMQTQKCTTLVYAPDSSLFKFFNAEEAQDFVEQVFDSVVCCATVGLVSPNETNMLKEGEMSEVLEAKTFPPFRLMYTGDSTGPGPKSGNYLCFPASRWYGTVLCVVNKEDVPQQWTPEELMFKFRRLKVPAAGYDFFARVPEEDHYLKSTRLEHAKGKEHTFGCFGSTALFIESISADEFGNVYFQCGS